MVAKKGNLITTTNGTNLLVDDVNVINGQEYLVLYDMTAGAFCIATEEKVDNNVRYNMLDHKEAIKIAEEIDKIKKSAK